MRSKHGGVAKLGTRLATSSVVSSYVDKRVSVAITANSGNTLCGFCTTGSPQTAGRLFASSVRRLRRERQTEAAPVVMSVESASKRYASLWEAERGLEQALDLAPMDKATGQHAAHG